MNHVFIDLETLGTRAGSAIHEIGAVAFNLDTGMTGAEFFREVLPAAPFTASIETLRWREEKGLGPIPSTGLSHREAITQFLVWLDTFVPVADPKERVFWAWGQMDFHVLEPILDFRCAEDAHPWEYWQINDARGFWKLAFGDKRHGERPHRALGDAILGARDLVAAVRELRFGKIQGLLDALTSAEVALDWFNTDPRGELGLPTTVADNEIKRIRAARLAVTGKEAA